MVRYHYSIDYKQKLRIISIYLKQFIIKSGSLTSVSCLLVAVPVQYFFVADLVSICVFIFDCSGPVLTTQYSVGPMSCSLESHSTLEY